MFFTRVHQSDQFQLRLTLQGEALVAVACAQAIRPQGVIDLGQLLSNRGRPSLGGVHAVVLDLDEAGAARVRSVLGGGAVELGLEILWEDDSLLGTYLLHGAQLADADHDELEDLEAEVRVVVGVEALGFED